MRLSDDGGSSFEMDIVGYQYGPPDHGINEPNFDFSDCNWLMVRGRVTVPEPQKSWEFLRPILNTHELKELSEYFKWISLKPIPRLLEFVEPNLHFSYVPTPHPEIRVRLSHESASPWNQRTFPGYEELVFPVVNEDLTLIAVELHGLVERFPSRNT